uniref:Uncharacterized protein n=1 Tax=Lepeophtheirus salmonis TaxID=72036 RepID=A0A0K2TI66_LEPSM
MELAYDVITGLGSHLNLNIHKFLGRLSKYRVKKGFCQGDGIWQSSQHISPPPSPNRVAPTNC